MKGQKRIVKLTNVRIERPILSFPADAGGAVAVMVTVPIICDLTPTAAEQLGIPSDQFKDGSKAKTATYEAPPDNMSLTFDPVNKEKTSRSFHVVSAAVHQPTANPLAIKLSFACKKNAKALGEWLLGYQGEMYNLTMVAEQTELPLGDKPDGKLPGASTAPPPNPAGKTGPAPARKAVKKAAKKAAPKK